MEWVDIPSNCTFPKITFLESNLHCFHLYYKRSVYIFLLLHCKWSIVPFLLSFTLKGRVLVQVFRVLVYIVNMTICYFWIILKGFWKNKIPFRVFYIQLIWPLINTGHIYRNNFFLCKLSIKIFTGCWINTYMYLMLIPFML